MDSKPLVVLLDTRARHWNQNPYISMLVDAVTPNVQMNGFSWKSALFSRYDVVHVHWPEYLLQHSRRPIRIAARILFTLWLVRLKLFAIPLITTVHNRKPHQSLTSSTDTFLLKRLARIYSRHIWLQDPQLSNVHPRPSDVVIPHGDYRPWVEKIAPSVPLGIERSDGPHAGRQLRILCFGILKEYKNIHEPVSAVRAASDLRVSLAILGSAPDADYISRICSLAGGDPRIRISPGRVPDVALIDEILSSDVVVVPYSNMFNSGVVLLALTLGRPVVVQANQVTKDLQGEFGTEWVFTYEDGFDDRVLRDLVSASSSLGGVPMPTTNRSWGLIGGRHAQLYREVSEGTPASPAHPKACET